MTAWGLGVAFGATCIVAGVLVGQWLLGRLERRLGDATPWRIDADPRANREYVERTRERGER